MRVGTGVGSNGDREVFFGPPRRGTKNAAKVSTTGTRLRAALLWDRFFSKQSIFNQIRVGSFAFILFGCGRQALPAVLFAGGVLFYRSGC